MIAKAGAVELSEVTGGQAPKWRAASAAVTGSIMIGFMPIITLELYRAGIGAPSMLVWRYGLALVPLGAAAAAAGHDFGAALRGGAWRIALVGATLGGRADLVLLGKPAHPRHQHRDPVVLHLSGGDPGARSIDLQAADPPAGGAVHHDHRDWRRADCLAGSAQRRSRPARADVDFTVAGNLRALSRRQFGIDALPPAADWRDLPLSWADRDVWRREPLYRPRYPGLDRHLAMVAADRIG